MYLKLVEKFDTKSKAARRIPGDIRIVNQLYFLFYEEAFRSGLVHGRGPWWLFVWL